MIEDQNHLIPFVKLLYKDEHYAVFYKPSGLLVHPMSGVKVNTTLLPIARDMIGQYLYPIQRLDRPVSGPIVFGLSSESAKELQKIWHSDAVIKKYYVLAKSDLIEPGVFDFALKNDKKTAWLPSITEYIPIKSYGEYVYFDVSIKTGRRHQIRRHFSRRCMNIVGDRVHGKGKINNYFRDEFGLSRIFLQCHTLNFLNPFNQKKIEISIDLDSELQSVLSKI